ncbi:hypothetical protein B0H14DRAFT_2592988 [Mycena olivaceomarginata]|nr:hypothetical protein B0H14DRAFT_2592988 [Mycena olivaceomarginata]
MNLTALKIPSKTSLGKCRISDEEKASRVIGVSDSRELAEYGLLLVLETAGSITSAPKEWRHKWSKRSCSAHTSLMACRSAISRGCAISTAPETSSVVRMTRISSRGFIEREVTAFRPLVEDTVSRGPSQRLAGGAVTRRLDAPPHRRRKLARVDGERAEEAVAAIGAPRQGCVSVMPATQNSRHLGNGSMRLDISRSSRGRNAKRWCKTRRPRARAMRRILLQDPHIKQSFFFILWPRGKIDEPEAREGGKSLRLWIGEDFDNFLSNATMGGSKKAR